MKKIFFAAVLFFLCCIAPFASAQDVLDIKQSIEIKPLGDTFTRADFKCSPELYRAIKLKFPTPELFVQRFLTPDKFDAEPRNLKASYDDKFFKVHVEMDVLGMCKNRGSYWTLEIGVENETVQPLDINSRQAHFESVEEQKDLVIRTETSVALPSETVKASFDADSKNLVYSLPEKKHQGTSVDIKAVIRRKNRLMTSIYKIYGSESFSSLWVAKVLFTNNGDVPIKSFKVKFSLGSYSDGYSETFETESFLPGQSIVEVYRPVLNTSCAQLQSATPVNLKIHYSYVLPNGETKEKEILRRVELLGYRDFVFSSLAREEIKTFSDKFDNADYISAWVTSEDAVVTEFGGMANKLAQGAGAAVDDSQATLVCAGIYELMRFNRISYQSPAGLFNTENVQRLKYPRNTLRDKSGTCIDLAIAFSAFAEAQGLNPLLILIPGHCFPAVFLPKSGNILPVEMTLLGGGTEETSDPFDKAVETGMKELEKSISEGNIIFVNIGDMKQKGLVSPELESLPPDILGKWGFSFPEGQRSGTDRQKQQPQTVQNTRGTSQVPSGTSDDWTTWTHPKQLFSIKRPATFFYLQPDEYTVNFFPKDKMAMVQVITLPKVINNSQIGEKEIRDIFVSCKTGIVTEKTTISEPEEVSVAGLTAIGRKYNLVYSDGSSSPAFSFYFNAGDVKFLVGCLATEDAFASYTNIFQQMTESMKFGFTVYPPE